MRTPTLLTSLGLGAAALLAALVAASAAIGGGVTIAVIDNSFSPAAKSVSQGTSVTWSFQGARSHTSTSNQGFWNSEKRSTGQTFSKTMSSAGRFPYHCVFHASMGMKGSIVVPLKADGSAGSGWTLRWSTTTAPSGRAFDVQYRRQGTSTWRSFRTNTSAATGLFNPAQSGSYDLRARTSNTAQGKESGWSPVISRQIS